MSADGHDWVLLNASPDLRTQIQMTPALQPQGVPRGSPIGAVVLTGAEVDQVAGLLTLRERGDFTVYATAETLAAIEDNPIFGVLATDVVRRNPVALAQAFALPNGLHAELFTVPGKVALYLEKDEPELAAESGVNVGVEVTSDGARLAYVPGAAAITKSLMERLDRANVILFDGTLFDDNEMIAERHRDKNRTSHGSPAARRCRWNTAAVRRPDRSSHFDAHQQYQSDSGRWFAATAQG